MIQHRTVVFAAILIVCAWSLTHLDQALGQGSTISRILIGSCIKQDRPMPIFKTIVDRRPELFLFLGDNIYADTTDMEVMRAKYAKLGTDPGFQQLIEACPVMAIWDDHDFGPNKSDRTFKWRDLTLDLFKKYWPNPSAGTPETPGIFYSFKIADVEFFMLDDRYHRDPNEAPDRTTMLGTGQLAWLRDSLKQARPPLR
jgi:alkaline phosphatase D